MVKTQNISTIGSYSELKKRVREALARGRERAADAVEREKVKTCWEVGRLIHEHVFFHKERADYGKQVINRLAADLDISPTEVYRMWQFGRANPNFAPAQNLSWGHYRELLAIDNPEDREALTKQASQKNWPRETLRSEIKKLKAAKQITVSEPPGEELLTPLKGTLDIYRLVLAEAGPLEGKPIIDRGFANYLELDHPTLDSEALKFKEGDIVQSVKTSLLGPYTLKPTRLTGADIYTYRAYVLEITDGDTLWLWIDLGFGGATKQHVRLRGIDAPELNTRAGQRAKRFVESQLKNVPSVVITSTKSDKYDRYLTDIFYETKQGEQFLNHRLLQERLAVRV